MEKENVALIIISNETFQLGLAEEITQKLSNLHVSKAVIKLLPKIDETILIKHYREHLISWNGRTGKSYAPSIGWASVRERYSSPVVVLLLTGEGDNLCSEVLQLKGPTDPRLCKTYQLRYSGVNKTYNLVHSSDSVKDVYLEASLYFSEEELHLFYNDCIGEDFKYILEMIDELSRVQSIVPRTDDKVFEKIDYMISWLNEENRILGKTNEEEIKLDEKLSIEKQVSFLTEKAIIWNQFDKNIYTSAQIIKEIGGS